MNEEPIRIDRLTDQQVLAVLDGILGEVAPDETPEGPTQQAEALQALLVAEDKGVDFQALRNAEGESAARAARELLALFAAAPATADSVHAWVEDPPEQEAAAVPLVLAAPLVVTGCVVLLQLAGHTRFRRDSSGHWSVDYDPGRRTPFDSTVTDMVGTLSRLMQAMTGMA